MKLTVHTERGVFVSKEEKYTADELKRFVDLVKMAASGDCDYLQIETDDGRFILGKELMASSVFVISEDEPIPQA